MNLNMEDDGFKLVKNRRRKRYKKSIDTIRHEYMNDIGTLNLNSKNDIVEKIQKCLYEISFFVKIFDTNLKEIIASPHHHDNRPSRIDQIVCFGLGNFTRSRSSLYQFALLKHLMEHDEFIHPSAKFIIYDPIFTEFERNILKSFGFQILQNNNNCRYTINRSSSSNESIILFFMPHMDYNHYYNVLDCNRENIDHIIIFGNSFNNCMNETYFTEYSTDLRRFLQQIGSKKLKLIEHHLFGNKNDHFYNEIFYRQSLQRLFFISKTMIPSASHKN